MSDQVKAPILREVRNWPATCNPAQVALALGISRSSAYEVLRRGDFPARAIRVGGRWRVLTASLVSVLEGNANSADQGGQQAGGGPGLSRPVPLPDRLFRLRGDSLMSLPGTASTERNGPAMTDTPADFERTPPHDVAAEQCVLGGMLLSKDAISDVIEVIRPADHYRPAHQLIHEAILDLYGRGEPADAITVANELTRRGEIARVGGGPYLHTLIASVPTAANAGYYARIVRERAILRRLVEAGTRIVQFGYAGEADADDLVDRAQAEVYAVTDRRTSESAGWLPDYDLGALADKGVPSPDLLCGDLLYAGGLHSIAGAPDTGKSVLCYWWALQLRRDGRNVMILDEEAGPEQVVEKMSALGATVEDLRPPGFTYVPFPARTRHCRAQAERRRTAASPHLLGLLGRVHGHRRAGRELRSRRHPVLDQGARAVRPGVRLRCRSHRPRREVRGVVPVCAR
jgi:hypothetical protein